MPTSKTETKRVEKLMNILYDGFGLDMIDCCACIMTIYPKTDMHEFLNIPKTHEKIVLKRVNDLKQL